MRHRNGLPEDLVEWRKRKGISLSAIVRSTKISSRYLEAIECGRFGDLPGAPYNVSYVRQYAQAIHYDSEQLLKHYRSVMTPAPIVAEPPPPDTLVSRVRELLRSLHLMHPSHGLRE